MRKGAGRIEIFELKGRKSGWMWDDGAMFGPIEVGVPSEAAQPATAGAWIEAKEWVPEMKVDGWE